MSTQVSTEKKVAKVSIDEAGFRNVAVCYGRDRKVIDAHTAIRRGKGNPDIAFEGAVTILGAMRALDADAQRMLKALLTLDTDANPHDCYALAQETIDGLRAFTERGGTYTPKAGLIPDVPNMPSDMIAKAILGESPTSAKIRAGLAKVTR